MQTSRRPISFIATARPDQARAFYADVIGLTLVEQSPYALVYRDGTEMLRVQIVADLTPVAHTVHGWEVSDIVQQIETLTEKGVAMLRFDQLPQDESGIWTTPDGHHIAWFKDPDGNLLSLTQFT